MKKISIFLLSIFVLLTTFTADVYAEDYTIDVVTSPATVDYVVKDDSGNTITSYITASSTIKLSPNGNNLIIDDSLTLIPSGETEFLHFKYVKPGAEGITIDSEITLSTSEVKGIVAVFNEPPPGITFIPNVDGFTYTSTPVDISSISAGENVTFTINTTNPNTTQLNYIECFSSEFIDVTQNGTQLSFAMPAGAVQIKANGGTIIKDLNISLTLPTQGDTTVSTPTISGTGYTFGDIVLADITTSIPTPVDATNPVVAGNKYVLIMGIQASNGYTYKYTGTSTYTEGTTSDPYKYTLNLKINGETISSYANETESVELEKNGYLGGNSNAHNQLTVTYLFTATEAPAPTNPTSPSSGGSDASYDHPIPNTGVK